jgi:tRNA pseudouridine38-40 synthase
MRVIRLTLAYDGTGFRGWARQRDPGIRTIEGELTAVLARVIREDVRLSVAGRTDSGVHARGQVVSFASATHLEVGRLQRAINSLMSPEVVVVDAREAPSGFDARFSASAREYRYVIDTAVVADPFTVRYVWHRPRPLSVGRMRAGANPLIGEHDFASFCRHPGAGKPTIRDLRRLSMTRDGSRVHIAFGANAFLHQMVRAIVGTLVLVGDGKLGPDDVRAILEAQRRPVIATLAPARGLTLERVMYGTRGR